ncbi:MAG TPA: DNA gyrase C-terminal beta-propeller domain-containing protein, partial [Candidatus Deferrimicrobium sp.]|nr:DNA gyrase C-terminal beta-propeller domain-containing protein [Candidatus Deferrimicrobium sp.]
VKRTYLAEYASTRTHEAIVVGGTDELLTVFATLGESELFLATALGMCIRFPEGEISLQGRKSGGMKGISLDMDDMVVAAELINSNHGEVLTISETGWAKRSVLEEYKTQGRAGKGIAIMKLDNKKGTGALAAVKILQVEKQVFVCQSQGGVTRVEVGEIPLEARVKTGKPVVDVLLNDYITKVLE